MPITMGWTACESPPKRMMRIPRRSCNHMIRGKPTPEFDRVVPADSMDRAHHCLDQPNERDQENPKADNRIHGKHGIHLDLSLDRRGVNGGSPSRASIIEIGEGVNKVQITTRF